MTDQASTGPDRPSGISGRMTQDVVAGLFLIAIAAFFLYHARGLPLGSLRAMGPGMLPTSIAWIMGAGGALLMVLSLISGGAVMTRPHVRGLFFVLGGIFLFGLTIRSLGLVVAGPAAMIFASFATEEVRPLEATIFAVVMTGFCILLFKYALGLPIPVVAFM
ncbi:MAG: hypothetical protein JWN93_1667 [Hyphomicrobiales bacterium]|jgi:hypothetical protein|nr:hypothetical protein [Hyphomicrobiales bacterium]